MVECDSFMERWLNESSHYILPFLDWLNNQNLEISSFQDFKIAFINYYTAGATGSYVIECMDMLDMWDEVYKEFKAMKRQTKKLKEYKQRKKDKELIRRVYKFKKAMPHIKKEKIEVKEYNRTWKGKIIKHKAYIRTYKSWTANEKGLLKRFLKQNEKTKIAFEKYKTLGYDKTYSAFKTMLSRLRKELKE